MHVKLTRNKTLEKTSKMSYCYSVDRKRNKAQRSNNHE